MILDDLLSNLAVKVAPFATCEVALGWRLDLPGPPGVLLHFVLEGHGAIKAPNDAPRDLAPLSLAVVPAGMSHQLQSVGPISDVRSINSVPSDSLPSMTFFGNCEKDQGEISVLVNSCVCNLKRSLFKGLVFLN